MMNDTIDNLKSRAHSYIESLITETKSCYGSFESMSKLIDTLIAYQNICLFSSEETSELAESVIRKVYEDSQGEFYQSARSLLSAISQSKPAIFKFTLKSKRLLENYLKAISYRVYKLNDSRWVLYDKRGHCWLIFDFIKYSQDDSCDLVYYSANGQFREDLQLDTNNKPEEREL